MKMKALKKLRVVQVGVGRFGATRRQRMRATGLFELVAAYDVNPAALAECQREDGAQPAGSYEQLLNRPGIEAVIISTGAVFHAEQAVLDSQKEPQVFVEVKGETDPCGDLRSFHRAIREGGQPYPSLIDGARTVQVVCAAEEAARLGRPVVVRAI